MIIGPASRGAMDRVSGPNIKDLDHLYPDLAELLSLVLVRIIAIAFLSLIV